MIGYVDPRERIDSPLDCPYEEARRYFNLLAQLTGMLVGDAVEQLELPALSPAGRGQGLEPRVMKAIKDGILGRIPADFSAAFGVEMQVLSQVVDGLVASDFASSLVKERVLRDRQARCV